MSTFSRDVLDATGCLVVVVEVATGHVADVNQVVLDATGYERVELVGAPLTSALLTLADVERTQTMHLGATSACSGAPFEAPLLSRAGDSRRVLWTGRPLRGGPRATSYVVLSGLDLSTDPTRGGLVSQVLLADGGGCSIGTDLEGRVTHWSDEVEQLLGWSRDEMTGRPLPLTLFEPAQLRERAERLGLPADLRLLLEDASRLDRRSDRRSDRRVDLGAHERRGGATGRGTRTASEARAPARRSLWTLVRKDGSRVVVAGTVRPVRNGSGDQVGFLGVVTDVTEQQRTHALLVSALEREADAGERLRELDEAKDRLIATVSHELRTPLASIDGYTELLEDELGGALTGQQRDHVEAIRRNTDRLSRLVEDLLTLSGIEAGTARSSHVEVDLRDAVAQAWGEARLDSWSPPLSTSLELPAEPVLVRGDTVSLARAVRNLLSNAVKCTAAGGSVSCVLESHDGGARVVVADTGFGIPVEEQGALFTRFFRTSTAQEREIPGSGLGLAIAATIVRGCGGDISVDSAHLRGAAFTLELPLARARERRLRVVS